MSMSRRRKYLWVGIVMALAGYVTSYWMTRESSTVRHERDGCPTSGCTEVAFPGDGLYLIYAPLYQVDKFTDPETEFYVDRSD